MAETFVPLISSSQAGPLGFAHLPRLWLKMRAHAAGVLPEGYRHGAGGFDEALLTKLGVDLGAFTGFIDAEAPDYLTCEAWIRAHAADTSLALARAFTGHIATFEMPDPRLSEWTARFGLSAGTFTKGYGMNQLDDWDGIHVQLRSPAASPLVPAVGSGVAGPLGVRHLPRMWLKYRLHGAGRLAEGYKHGRGFDKMVTDALGLDPDALATFVEGEQPDYLATEAWVRQHATALNPPAIAELNERILATKLMEKFAVDTRARLGITDLAVDRSIALNDLDDWLTLHQQLKAVVRV
jgi:uncharacterized protein DUF5069